MCFSPQADLVGGMVVGGLAIDACRHVSHRRERALAAVPVVLAVHQLVEVPVWLGLEHHVSATVWRPAMYAYLVIAFVVVPILVPLAVGGLEPQDNRGRVGLFLGMGVVVAAVLGHGLAGGPVTARIVGHHISYQAHDLAYGGVLVVAYLMATCGSMLVSHTRDVRRFGLVNLVAAIALATLYQNGFISLWCAWAAVTSLLIAWHLRRGSGG
ncbi:MAG TPA: DUF6629 family protein, partial [Acidimicrobiales bacterium]